MEVHSVIVNISSVELDTSIQCRASVDTVTVSEYAERMAEGDEFPPVVLFGGRSKCWIGDGWHRVFAAIENGDETIHADLRPGNRQDALRHALGANAVHGQRRTNEDIRRSVNLALDEFPDMTNVALAELCRVNEKTIRNYRAANVGSSDIDTEPRTVTRSNGRPYTVTPRPTPEGLLNKDEIQVSSEGLPPLELPCRGMQYARMAVTNMEQIPHDDEERSEAFEYVRRWLDANQS